MEHIDRRIFKREGEELQQYLHFRKRGAVVENAKRNKKRIRNEGKNMCRNATWR